MSAYTMNKTAYTNRLRRIEGQVRGLERMIENDEYCIDVLVQVASATAALRALAVGLLDEHLRHCVVGAAAANTEKQDNKISEAVRAIELLLRA